MTRGVWARRWLLFWLIALGGAAFDLAAKAMVFKRIGEPPAAPVPLVAGVLELQTSYNPGASGDSAALFRTAA